MTLSGASLRFNCISTSMPSSASPGIPPEPPAAYGPTTVSGLPNRHGNGGRGQQPTPPQGASGKTSGSISTSIPPELPAVYGSLPGDDETARLPSSPLAASKRPAGALSPIDVALFPTFPCTAECCLKPSSGCMQRIFAGSRPSSTRGQ